MLIYNIYIPCSVTLTKIAQSFGYEVSFPAISKYKKKERKGKGREGKGREGRTISNTTPYYN